ncbi:chaoptin [Anopheles nili]|uniref:chaoptin n=1 Tax=Anopheles nili TaxID=185578 RepID=UPI00237BEC32|nr:chaoptin [Anopheles nili]
MLQRETRQNVEHYKRLRTQQTRIFKSKKRRFEESDEQLMEQLSQSGKSRQFYKMLKKTKGGFTSNVAMCRDEEGNILTDEREKCREHQNQTHHPFIDFKAAYDTIDRTELWNTMQQYGFPGKLVHLLRATMDGVLCKNLPELQKLDLAYNSLESFDFIILDQVGSLTSLEVDVSHNMISTLGTIENSTDKSSYFNDEHMQPTIYSNIRSLDFSNNNISKILPGYFRPSALSLMNLVLSHNKLSSIKREVFESLSQLNCLDFSNNVISEIEYDTLHNMQNLQIFKLSHNILSDVPAEIFRSSIRLRVLELDHNNLKYLPDNLLFSNGLERLNVSHNLLTKIPVSSMSNMAAMTLCELDLSHNLIEAVHINDLSNKFRSLAWLDLSHNQLLRVEDATFVSLPRLSILNLSHNNKLKIMEKAFVGLQDSLLELILTNIRLTNVPELSNPTLRSLKISHNVLTSIPPELAANITSLRELDLSENDLTNVPLITHSLTNLKSLSLSGNPITSLFNTSFAGTYDTLEYLDISNLNINYFEFGILNKLRYLRSLKISTFPSFPNFNIPRIIQNVKNLREIWIEAAKSTNSSIDRIKTPSAASKQAKPDAYAMTDLHREMEGILPRKLQSIIFGGGGFNRLSDSLLKGFQSATLRFRLHNTSIVALPENFFLNVGKHVRAISVSIDNDNNELQSIPNPNTAPYLALPEHIFLTKLQISGIILNCDCKIGWIEFWQRKRRQYLCPANPSAETSFTNILKHSSLLTFVERSDCSDSANELRRTLCRNKNNDTLLDVLKKDLECGWGSSSHRLGIVPATTFVLVFVVLLF